MAETFTDEGLDYLLGIALAGGTVDTTLYLGFFTSQTASTVPARTAVGGASPSGWTESTGTGYARIAVTTGNWGAAATNGSGRRRTCAQKTLTGISSATTLNGFFLATNSASGAGDTILCFANFDSGVARTLTVGTDELKLTPSVQFDV